MHSTISVTPGAYRERPRLGGGALVYGDLRGADAGMSVHHDVRACVAACPATMSDREMHRVLSWPYEGERFPAGLGAVVQNTVLRGEQPAREVIHTPENDWCIGDGVNDPNVAGACTATHIWHVIEWNSSIADLASMPPGHIAERSGPGQPWTVKVLVGWGEDDPPA